MNHATLIEHIESILATRVASAKPLSGGDVSSAMLVTTANGERMVIKHGAETASGMFASEADGLGRLSATGAVRTPHVVCVYDGPDTKAAERFLALEYITQDARSDPAFGPRFGESLARMHLAGSSPDGRYGLDRDNYLGRQPQTNAWSESFAEFYRRRRVAPQLAPAREILGSRLAARVDSILEDLDEILAGMPHSPCLIHGDLWSGNYLVSGAEPVLIDPAVYYGHPEIEWAFIDLFGGFPSGMRAGYDKIAPLNSGYETRRPVLQLYHVLVHVNHFGTVYAPAVQRICEFYAA
jgi:fructosamine-3-kinase